MLLKPVARIFAVPASDPRSVNHAPELPFLLVMRMVLE